MKHILFDLLLFSLGAGFGVITMERSTPLSWRSASQRINPTVSKSPIRMRFP